jgi:hypothetical protein
MSTAVDLAKIEAAIAEHELDDAETEQLRELAHEHASLEAALAQVLETREEATAPPAAPQSEEEPAGEPSDKQLRALDRENARHEAKVREIMGGFVAGWQPCSKCDGLALEEPGPEPQTSELYRECPKCKGFAKVLTGSRDPLFAFAPCPGCGGRGFQERMSSAGTPIAQGEQPAPLSPAPSAAPASPLEPAAAVNGAGEGEWGTPAWMGVSGGPARRQALREWRAEIELARDRREPWLVWIEARADGIRLHDLHRETGEPIACPVGGCDAVRISRPAPSSSGAPRRPAEPERLTLC